MRRGWRQVFDRHLVEGLTTDERIARLEGAVLRAQHRERQAETETFELQLELELAVNLLMPLVAAERRRRLPFYRRWFTKGSR